MLNKFITILLFFCVISSFLLAQEVLQPMQSNPNLKKQNSKKKTAYISLPFFDDFSYASLESTFPKTALWADKYVYINNNYGLDPISIGVATFDAIGANGKLYPAASKSISFSADTLTSCYINLKGKTAADSIYLSFFYQPGGFGEMPDANDLFLLQFKEPGTNPRWDSVWSVKGSSVAPFKQIFRAVIKESYLKDSFQFRFINRASINISSSDPGKNSNGDIWNLDYVYMNQGRTNTDSVLKNEVAIIYPPQQSMLNNFESMPYAQFKIAFAKERASKFKVPLRNYKNSSVLVLSTINITDGFVNFEPIYNSVPVEPRLFLFEENLPPLSSDAAEFVDFEITLTISTDILDSIDNNTVTYIQKFSNYFAYDDGTAEYGYGLSGEGANNAMLAMHFKTYKEETIIGVEMFLNEAIEPKEDISKNFYLTIWNEQPNSDKDKIRPGDTLYKKLQVNGFGYKNEWHTFALDPPLIVPKNYFVGWIQQSSYFANVGFDRNRNAMANTFFNLEGTDVSWEKSIKNGAIMIRPIIKTIGNPILVNTKVIEKINVYPNPATDVLYINLPGDEVGKNYKLQICNLAGSIIYFKENIDNSINISQLQPGIYILKIASPNGVILTSKFIKKAR